jgi:hypothetical protein
MFSIFKKKKLVAHIKLNGVIGNAGKFKQGIDFSGQEEIIEKAFSLILSISLILPIYSLTITLSIFINLFMVRF